MHNKQAFTMLEIVLTIVLLALAIIPSAGIMQRETKTTALNKKRVFARHLAHNIIERLKMERIDALKIPLSDPSASTVYLNDLPLLNPNIPDEGYQRLFDSFTRCAWLEEGTGVNAGKTVLHARVEWLEGGHTRNVTASLLLIQSNAPRRY